MIKAFYNNLFRVSADGASGFVNKLYSSGDSQQPKENKVNEID